MAVQSPNRPPRRPPEPKRDPPLPGATGPHERHALLQTMLDHVAQAIALFDAQHRLVAWNDQLRALLDLSDDLVAGAPSYADFIAYLAARGDFGETSASVDAAVRELTA